VAALAPLVLLLQFSVALAQEPPTKQVAVERLTIQYEDGDFLLVNRQAFRKVLPPSYELPDGGGPFSGFWYELQDAAGTVLYRRMVDNPLVVHFEGPDIDTNGTVPDRKEAIAESKMLWILLPAPPTDSALVIFSSPLELGAQAEPAEEIGRVPLLPIIF
jgi:hypothetical protein